MIKKLSKYIRGYRGLAVITPILVVLESLLEILIPFVMADLIDKGIYGGSMDEITKYGLLLILAAFVSLSFGVAAGITAPFASAGFASNLRKAMFEKVQDYDFMSIDKFSTASIVTRLTTDVTNVQQAFQMIIRIFARAPSMLIFALIAAFRVNHKLSLVFLISMPILLIGMIIMNSKVMPIFERVFKNYDKMNNVVQENVRGMRVVKSFNRQEHEIDKFDAVSGTIFRDFSKAEKTLAWMAPMVQFCTYLCMVLLCWFGGKMIVEGWKEDRENSEKDAEDNADESINKVSNRLLFVQGVATSIDALSVGFAFATYSALAAFSASCIIAAVTLIICLGGIAIGRKFGMLFAGKASIMGGLILIIIGLKLIL